MSLLRNQSYFYNNENSRVFSMSKTLLIIIIYRFINVYRESIPSFENNSFTVISKSPLFRICFILGTFLLLVEPVLGYSQETGTLTPQSSITLGLNNTFQPTITSLNVSAVPVYVADPYAKVNTSGLIAWYRFDENLGTSIIDSSGLGHNSTATKEIGWTNLKYNSACSFNGVNSSISLPNNGMTCNNTMSFACWFNTTTNSTSKSQQVFISQTSGTLNRNYEIYLNGPTPTFLIGSGSDASRISFNNYNVQANHSYFIAYSVNSYSCTMWIYDGKEWYSSTGTFDYVLKKTSSSGFSIGYLSGTSTAWNGSLDNMLIWNRAINQSEVYSLVYDTSVGINAKTNSNNTYSSEIPANGSTVNVPYYSNDLPISSLEFFVPSTTRIKGISVYDYLSSLSPLNVTTNIDYNEFSSILKKDVNNTYLMNFTYSTVADHSTGVSINAPINDSNVIDAKWLGPISYTTNDSREMVTYNTVNHSMEIQTGPLTSGQTVTYKVSMAYQNDDTVNNASTINYEGFPLVTENDANNTYFMNVSYTDITNHPTGVYINTIVNDSNVISAGWLGAVNYTTTNSGGIVTYNAANHTIRIKTGSITSGQTVVYNVSMPYGYGDTVDNTGKRIIRWQGLNWTCKNVQGADPGSNNFSDSSDNIWVDDQQRLHLTIKKDSGDWNCTEIRCQNNYTFGKFTWKIDPASPVFNLSQESAWIGFFSYRDDNNETDIEISRWQVQGNHLILYTLQPYWIPGNSQGHLPAVTNSQGSTTTEDNYDGSGMTVSMDREPTYVDFTALDNNGNVIAYEHFTNSAVIDQGPEQLMMNFYLRSIPTSGPDVEIILDSLRVDATPV